MHMKSTNTIVFISDLIYSVHYSGIVLPALSTMKVKTFCYRVLSISNTLRSRYKIHLILHKFVSYDSYYFNCVFYVFFSGREACPTVPAYLGQLIFILTLYFNDLQMHRSVLLLFRAGAHFCLLSVYV